MVKNIFLVALFIYIFVLGLITWHLNDQFLMVLWLATALVFVVASIVLSKYIFLMIFFVAYVLLFSLVYSPYTSYVMQSGIIEKEISYEDGAIFIIKFLDDSTVTVIDGKDKQCFGREYKGKYYCRAILSMLNNSSYPKVPNANVLDPNVQNIQ